MRKDAEAHAEEDRKNREVIEERNKADSLIYSTEKNLKDHGPKIPESDRKRIEEAVEALKKAKDKDDAEEIRRRSEDLMNAAQKLGQILYEQAAQQRAQQSGAAGGAGPGSAGGPPPGGDGGGRQGRAGGPGGQKSGDNVVDADFEVLDEDKGEGGKK